MNGESARRDFKLAYDPTDQQAVLSLVKDLIAMANAGGGEIIFGRSETELVGMDDSQCKLLDSAQLANLVGKYASPATVHIEHEDHQLANGRVIRTIRIADVEYPLVMAHDGNYPQRSPARPKPPFERATFGPGTAARRSALPMTIYAHGWNEPGAASARLS